ncbi:alcohol dehydrogenase-like protein [Pseudomassariella vexata]|uniref:Alcohol dehydrogenase-like protein n=1 Tax=Pseudomassariella vexata TaxID=1141098 RepID=A0A1Y2DX36_9PEZI|nr:alcohol dehydrogenase-like protein [Pseudomassariella vexata]ORY63858.1 alcohol dehydrogenase-like protein [Pseudomassariella vexata]
MEIPLTHNAIIYTNPGTASLKITQVPTPSPGPGQVLIRLTHSGVCHSDHAVMTNSWRWLPGLTSHDQVGGHEGVGEVVKLGPDLVDSGYSKYNGPGIKIGDRVGIKWFASTCLHCLACMDSQEGSCFHPTISGYSVPGTFQEYVLAPANYVTPIPDGVPSDAAAPILCGGLTVYSAFHKARARAGEWVVISGAGGGLGSLACEIGSRGMGFRILGIDSAAKETLIRECGAEEFLPLDKFSRDPEGDKAMANEVMRITEGGAAAVLVCTSANAAYAQAVHFLRFCGTLVCVGITEGDEVPIRTVNPNMLIKLQLTVTASSVGNRKEAIEILNLVARGVVKPRFTLHKPAELGDIFARLEKGEILGRTVLSLDTESWK